MALRAGSHGAAPANVQPPALRACAPGVLCGAQSAGTSALSPSGDVARPVLPEVLSTASLAGAGTALGAALTLLVRSAGRRGGGRAVVRRKPQRVVSTTAAAKQAALTDEELSSAGYVGFSMDEARKLADAGQEAVQKKSPREVLAELQRGNTRFWMNKSTRPAETSAFERRALISKQFPSTAILGCADSRVPTEIVFDQGLGQVFTCRVAGNCLDTATQASLQFAVKYLGVKVLIVMGHEGCGAIKAAQLPSDDINKEPNSLGSLLMGLKSGLDMPALSRVSDPRALDREAVTQNVKKQVEKLTKDTAIMAKVKSKDLIIVGAFYEISSGIVDFFYEVSDVADPTSSTEKPQYVSYRESTAAR